MLSAGIVITPWLGHGRKMGLKVGLGRAALDSSGTFRWMYIWGTWFYSYEAQRLNFRILTTGMVLKALRVGGSLPTEHARRKETP